MIITPEMVEAACEAYVLKDPVAGQGPKILWGELHPVVQDLLRAPMRAALEAALSVASATAGARPDVYPLCEVF